MKRVHDLDLIILLDHPISAMNFAFGLGSELVSEPAVFINISSSELLGPR